MMLILCIERLREMAYVESFLLYIAAVVFMFIVLFGGVVVLYMLFGQLKIFFETEEVTLQREKMFLYKLVKNRFFKLAILVYFIAFGVFYIKESMTYFGKDRAYPQAKAYKIDADLISFYFDFFIANRNLYYRPIGLKFIKPYEDIQNYFMKKGFEYIPKEDAERAIWKYELYYANYVRATAAPIDFEKLTPDDLGYILRIGGHPTIYKAQAKQMLIEVEHLLDMLMHNPMKDKRYDQVERYTATILFSEWWQKFSFLHYTLGVRTVDEESSKEYRETIEQWTDDPKYLKRLSMLANWLDIVKKKIDSSKALQQEIKRYKLLYPDLMGLRVWFASKITYADLLNKKFSCDLESLKRYATKRKAFLNYTSTSKIFKKLSWKERLIADKSVQIDENALIVHILYSKCNITKKLLKYSNDIDVFDDEVYSKKEWKEEKILKGFKNGR